MKTACFFAAAAVAGAVAPPRISLNLEGMAQTYKLQNTIDRTHDLNYENKVNQANNADAMATVQGLQQSVVTTAVASKQDWTEKCPAGTTQAACPDPVATAYDHFDGTKVTVTERKFLVDLDGAPMTGDCAAANKDAACSTAANACCVTAVDYSKRSTYLFKYDASDKAGNHAEQVVFALILDDTTAPVFDQAGNVACQNAAPNNVAFEAALTVEAVSDWRLCKLSATDNIDSAATVTANIRYDINYLGRDNSVFDKPSPAWHSESYKAVDKHAASLPTVDTDLTWSAAETFFNQGNCVANTAGGNPLATPDFERLKHQANPASGTGKSHRCGPEVVGKYLVTGHTHDNAGVYGHNAANNVASLQTAILIQDTTAPTIFLEGHNPVYQECSKHTLTSGNYGVGNNDLVGYVEAGALCHDKLDTDALGEHLEVVVKVSTLTSGSDYSNCANSADTASIGCAIANDNEVDLTSKASYFQDIANAVRTIGTPSGTDRTLTYQCKDFALNAATEVTREVKTVDTEAPTLTLLGANVVSYSQNNCATEANNIAGCEAATHMDGEKEYGIHDPGVDQSEDRCEDVSGTANDMADQVTLSWGPKAFNARVLGDYVRTYTLKDPTGNTAFKTRTFTVIDEDQPIIKVQGDKNPTYGASRDIEYTDAGATCEDWVDGELSHAVEVSGEVVNYRIPGTYVIEYNCQDLTGNTAVADHRTVIIEDIIPPRITLNGAIVNFIEAGFPYVDAGATATDDLDGDITQYIWTDGNTVNDRRAYYASKTCGDLPTGYLSGEYYLTTKDNNGKFHRVLVHCTTTTSAVKFGFKIVQNTGSGSNADACSNIGMKLMTPFDTTDEKVQRIEDLLDASQFASLDPATSVFACEDVSESTADASDMMVNTGIITDELQNAEQGKYIINFKVEDKAGNSQAGVAHRTVIVKDTLPPVVSLSVRTKLANQDSQIVAPTADERTATALHNHGHEFYMAETRTSANGFIIGAVASAVAGVALLGVSMRKNTATSVPV